MEQSGELRCKFFFVDTIIVAEPKKQVQLERN